MIIPLLRMQREEKKCLIFKFYLTCDGFALKLMTAVAQVGASPLGSATAVPQHPAAPDAMDKEFTSFWLPAPNVTLEKLKMQAGNLLKKWLQSDLQPCT